MSVEALSGAAQAFFFVVLLAVTVPMARKVPLTLVASVGGIAVGMAHVFASVEAASVLSVPLTALLCWLLVDRIRRDPHALAAQMAGREAAWREERHALADRILKAQAELLIERRALTTAGAVDNEFRAMIDATSDAVVLVNKHGVVERVNDGGHRMFNWPKGTMIGMSVIDLIPERFRTVHRAHIENFFRHPESRPMGVGLELWGVRSDESEFPVEISLDPYQKLGEEPKVVAVIRDMTRR